MTRYELWAAILATSVALDRQVASEVGDLPSRGPGPGPSVGSPPPRRPPPPPPARPPARTMTPQLQTAWRDLPLEGASAAPAMTLVPAGQTDERDRTGLITLRAKVRAQLEALWALLEGEPGFERIRCALVIYFDERVMGVLPEYLRLSWPLLQTELTGSTSGGDDFYRFMDAALDDSRASSLVFEVYYFCLRHGFRGRHTNDLGRIADYERRLFDRIQIAKPSVAGAELAATGEAGRPWPLWAYYAIAALFVIGFCVALTVLSNYEGPPSKPRTEAGRALSSSVGGRS